MKMGGGSSRMRLPKGKDEKKSISLRSTGTGNSTGNSFPTAKNETNANPETTHVHRVVTDADLNRDRSNGSAPATNGIGVETISNKPSLNNDLDSELILQCFADDNPPLSARKQTELKLSKFVDKMTPSELYNMLIAETWQGLPEIHDPGYMLLVDCREKSLYEDLHIITARHHSALYSEYGLLLPSQLKLFHIIILYGHASSCYELNEHSKKLAEDEIDHYILQCGAEDFFTSYPFLSTQGHFLTSDLRSTLQTMPSEIIPGRLYQGNAKHALDPYIITSLGITHIVNVTLEHPNKFDDTVQYLRIQLDDRPHIDLHSWLPKTSEFIRTALKEPDSSGVVLVHCNLGRSRSSTVVLGYLMCVEKMSLGEASNLLKDCRPSVRPNFGFLEQLLRYEKDVFGISKTELNDLPF